MARLEQFLHQYNRIEDDDYASLSALPARHKSAHSSARIIREGEAAGPVMALVSGYAFQQKLTPIGSRQITHVYLPGEPLNLDALFLGHSHYSVVALTDVQLIVWPREHLKSLAEHRRNLFDTMLAAIAIHASMLRQRLLMVGRRDAQARLAHFFCECAARCEAAKLLDENGSFLLPMTQEQIGDVLGLTAIHVNRTIRNLESAGLIGRSKYNLMIPEFKALASIGSFDPNYLHL